MVFKNLFSGNTLKPDFSFSQKGNIWRMYFNNSGITVGETRDIYTKEAYLYSINYKKKDVYLRDFQIDEKWWFSIEGVTENNIILSHFVQPEMPETIGIHVIDIKNGEQLWRNNELIFLFAANEFIYGYKQLFESKILYKLSEATGNIIEEYREEMQIYNVLSEKNLNDEKQYEGYHYPEIYIPDDEEDVMKSYFPDFVKTLKLDGPVEYLQYNKYLIFNYHEIKGVDLKNIERKVLSNILNIIDLEKNKILFRELLNKETSSYVPDSFFIKDCYLFFIKEKKVLTSIKLS